MISSRWMIRLHAPVVIPLDRRGFGQIVGKHAWWSQSFLIHIAACGALALGVACGGGPSAPSGTSTSATLDSVVTTFRGALVESTPVTIPSPEALDVEIRLTLDVPADSKATVYLCVMESASAVGVGTCLGLSDTAKGILAHADPLRLGISTLKTDGVARTTNFVYVGLVEGAFPWPPSGSSPPRAGDRFGSNRVLATTQIARTITFR